MDSFLSFLQQLGKRWLAPMGAFLLFGCIVSLTPSGLYTVLLSKEPVTWQGSALNLVIGTGFIAGPMGAFELGTGLTRLYLGPEAVAGDDVLMEGYFLKKLGHMAAQVLNTLPNMFKFSEGSLLPTSQQ